MKWTIRSTITTVQFLSNITVAAISTIVLAWSASEWWLDIFLSNHYSRGRHYHIIRVNRMIVHKVHSGLTGAQLYLGGFQTTN